MGAFCPPAGRVEILPGGEEEKGLTNGDIWTKIHTITMAEVAVCISIAPGAAIAGAGKGTPPKISPVPNGGTWAVGEDPPDCHQGA